MSVSAKKLTGATLATTAAMLFAFAPATTVHAEEGAVSCLGINACKGQSACKTAANACAGQNACKGLGISRVSEAECTAKGGKIAQ
ncbi:MAG: hypothetical protein IT496_10820 [Gammaproteobacteria bacterium]|nr:hypothetical protein [Gammaproteobacteria bacterium]MCG3143359.1 hypothetical protein [Gammaproteobacteria bacterium]